MFLRNSAFFSVLLSIAALPGIAAAHSVIAPASTFTSKYETFSLGVPTERDVPTVSIHLMIPEHLDHVTPIVKPGWRVAISKNESGTVTKLTWTGGSIPAGQKDFFQFSARTPAEPTTLIWKAYQTYQDGQVVAWDQEPHSAHDASGVVQGEVSNPYSVTAVTADVPSSTKTSSLMPTALSLAALALSALALVLTLRNKREIV